MVKYYDEEDYLDVDSHAPYLKDELIDKEVAEKLSKEVSSNIIEQVKHNMNNMDNSIEERADRAIYEPTDGHPLRDCEVVAFARGYELGATEQEAIDIDKACEWLRARNVLTEASIEGFRKAMED